MKIIHYIRLFFAALRLKRKKHKYILSPSGECRVLYFINKYINETKPDDYIQAYEDHIENNKHRVLQMEFYKKLCLDENGEINPESLHYSSMLFTLTMLLFATANVEKYYALIENEDRREVIKKLVNIVR